MNYSDQYQSIADPVVCIMGPTASGKTALACELYDRADVDIISVDSALVYRDMNIGTAKPTDAELAQYPHALVNIIDPTEAFSAAAFVTAARRLIKQSHEKGRLPVLVGGTMMYYHALFGGLDALPQSQPEVRDKLQSELLEQGIQSLHRRLAVVDSVTAERLNSTDTQRIIRALEVFELSGKPLSSLQTAQDVVLPNTWKLLAIVPERKHLHERIAQRLDVMWNQGFIDEVCHLQDKYNLCDNMPSMRAVGYRQIWQYLKIPRPSEADRQTLQDKALFATRQLAKRQCTWLRKIKQRHALDFVETHSQGKKLLLDWIV